VSLYLRVEWRGGESTPREQIFPVGILSVKACLQQLTAVLLNSLPFLPARKMVARLIEQKRSGQKTENGGAG
jgi:hypothetical protein